MFDSVKNLFAKKGQGIGLEIAAERINIVQLRKQGQTYKLTTFITEEVPEGIIEEGRILDTPALAELIRETLDKNNIKAKKIATAVPMREAIIRLIPIPSELDDQELKDMVLNHEAGLYLPYPREEVDLDYQKLGFFEDEDGIEKVQVLLVATRREVTDMYLETFEQAELEIDVLEINSFALIRTIREQLRAFGPQEAVVLVDIEFESTEIAIIVDGVPQFSRTVPIGTFQLQNALSRAMNLPTKRDTEMLQGMTIPNTPVDGLRTGATGINPGMAALLRVLGELTDELRRSIDFYLNQSMDYEVAQLLLAGPGGGIGQLDEFFTNRLSLPTEQIDPVAALSLETDEEFSDAMRPGLGVALGLGLREV
ncbi:type IV pilus assembly protein PilM [Spirulina major CS-329]|jgi:type IV pilus assembly protein PilM|uniref:type IV pilus assembly protein PilM n=1 Tax=Spirulina TaxID=1154 RepID=UPI000934DDE7|nr:MULTISPECIES: type IV pilus assembly protein PilM [Spirulina]MDB9493740.1 type IV pilus assembly protein PilM [Spirulina subsalsa CS-330]MDB9501958.1 type IV pilus assembly protein PilM [Spirulina major CS-329]